MFVNPWAIALGMLALGAPLLIHWLTRPRPVLMPLSTIKFVQELIYQRRAMHRLRDWLVLLLRTAAVILLALAIARPLSGRRPLVSHSAAGETVRIVVLDVSRSLAAVSNGVRWFDRARTRAAEYLAYQPGLRANVIFAGAAADAVFDQPSGNFGVLRSELEQAAPRAERAKVQSALNLAAEMLAKGGAEGVRLELVVISDFQRANWSTADFSVLPENTLVELESVANADLAPNLAVTRVACDARAETGRDLLLHVEIANYSPTPQSVTVEVAIGAAVQRLTGQCPPLNKTVLTAETSVATPGWHAGEVRLTGVEDALREDNRRPFVLHVRPPPVYLLITRQAADQRPSSSYYLERALVPYLPEETRSQEKVVRIAPERLDRETLAAADLPVLDHVGRLSREAIDLLAVAVRRGRGLLYVTGERVDAANLLLLGEAAGSELQMPVELLAPAAGAVRRDLFLTKTARDLPPFNVFGDSVAKALEPLRFSGGLATRRKAESLAEDVLAEYSDGSAALVITPCGAGQVAVWNLDLDNSNLPQSSAFVPIVGELVSQLLGSRQGLDPVACGEPLAVDLPAEVGPALGLELVGPDDAPPTTHGELVEEQAGVLWRFAAAGPPGVYEVREQGNVVFALATAAPAEESELRMLTPDVITGRMAAGRNVEYRSNADAAERHDTAWIWLLAAAVACLCTEVLTLRLFRS